MKLKRVLIGLLILILSSLPLVMGCASSPQKGETGGTIAVWDLDDLSLTKGTQLHLGEMLSGKIIEVLKERSDFVVVERQRLLLALEELRLGTTQLVDETTRLKLGKMLGAKWMVFGGYQVIGNQMRLDLRLVEVETGRIKKAVQKTASASTIESWIEATQKAAEEL